MAGRVVAQAEGEGPMRAPGPRPARINGGATQSGATDRNMLHLGSKLYPHSVALEWCEAVLFTSCQDASHGRQMGEHRIDRLIL